jgi:hypothetical protein
VKYKHNNNSNSNSKAPHVFLRNPKKRKRKGHLHLLIAYFVFPYAIWPGHRPGRERKSVSRPVPRPASHVPRPTCDTRARASCVYARRRRSSSETRACGRWYVCVCGCGCGCEQGISPQFPGVLVGPPHVRKCHQMSPKEHIQLGWVVRWALSTPSGPPHGWAVCTCRASTSLAPLYSPCASSAFDWGSKPHSRSAPAPVESSPGPRTHCPFNRGFILETAVSHFDAAAPKRDWEFRSAGGRSADVVEPHYALWGRAVHPGPCVT